MREKQVPVDVVEMKGKQGGRDSSAFQVCLFFFFSLLKKIL